MLFRSDIHHRALPGHPARQGAHFVERHIGRIAHPAFGGTARDGVLHPVAGEHFQLPIVHGDRDVDDDLAVGVLENAPQALIEFQFFGRQVEARSLLFPRITFLLKSLWCGLKISPNYRGRLAARFGGRLPRVASSIGGQTYKVYAAGCLTRKVKAPVVGQF